MGRKFTIALSAAALVTALCSRTWAENLDQVLPNLFGGSFNVGTGVQTTIGLSFRF